MSTTKKNPRPLTMRQTLDRLRHIANSPNAAGGFDVSIVAVAAAALHHIRRLQAKVQSEKRRARIIASDNHDAAAMAAAGD